MTEPRYPLILSGIVGSTAYGLAREGSDIDRLGVFAAPTRDVLGMAGVTQTVHSAGPDQDVDVTAHEVGKFIRLAVSCNPTVLELLFLQADLLEVSTADGALLRAHRHAFLSEQGVRNAFAGYATSQARKLAERGDGTFSSTTRGRTVKHGRHMLRLLRSGASLLGTGELAVRVSDPGEYFAFDDMSVEQMLAVFETARAEFDATVSVLPARADLATVNDVLLTIRDRHYTPAAAA